VLYYRYEEEKDQDPKASELDRSCRALSSRWSDEEPQEGSEQESMPWKGARMKVGDLVRNLNSESGTLLGVIVKFTPPANPGRLIVAWNDGRVSPILKHLVEVVDESR